MSIQINAGFDAVGYAGPDLTWDPLEDTKDFFSIINGDTLVFDEALIGINFIAVHFAGRRKDPGRRCGKFGNGARE